MRVLILSHSSELAGAELSMVDLFAYLEANKDIEPYFIIRKPVRGLSKVLREKGWPYESIYYTNWSNRNPDTLRRPQDVYRNALYNTKAIFEIEEIIKRVKPDIVMTNTIVSPWAAIAAYFQRVPHVWFVREYGDVDHKHVFEIGYEKMIKDIGNMSRLVATNSLTLAKHVGRYVDASKLTTIYNPFDIELLKERSRKNVGNPFKRSDSLKLVITGRIAPSKGQDSAASAVAKLVKKGYDVELCVVGTCSEQADRKDLDNIIKENNLNDRVHLVGHQSNPLAYVKYADVGIMASRGEAFGRVTFEYLTLGLPVVGANSGATPELVEDGKNGYLYEQGDVKDLATKIENYARDPELIKKHSKRAEKKVIEMMNSEFSAASFYERLREIADEGADNLPIPLNYSHRWLEYPEISRKYIKETEQDSLKRLLLLKLRHRAKFAYLILSRVYRLIVRTIKRDPAYGRQKAKK